MIAPELGRWKMPDMEINPPARRWPVALGIVLAVVLISAAIIYAFQNIPQPAMGVNAVTDGAGGVIVVWHDDDGVYAQHVDSSGQFRWPENRIIIGTQPDLAVVGLQPDGLGGAIITLSEKDDNTDPVSFDPNRLYARRLSAQGELLWQDTPIFSGWRLEVVPDGTGGAFFACDAFKPYLKALRDSFLRVQRVAPDGRRLWGEEGLLVVASSPYRPITPEEVAAGEKGTISLSYPTYSGEQKIVSDGDGGIIVLWEVHAKFGEGDNQVFAQRLDGDGNYIWPAAVATGATHLKSAASDDAGGVIIFSHLADETPLKSGSLQSGMVFAHMTGAGDALPLSTSPPNISLVIGDGLGGTFHIRQEVIVNRPPDSKVKYYIQRFDALEKPVWPERLLISDDLHFIKSEYIADATGGLIIVLASQLPGDILVFRVDDGGLTSWGGEGMPILNLDSTKYRYLVNAFGDGSGGIIITGTLGKGALSSVMIYVQRLDIAGKPLWGDGVRIND